jgi:hypothetical protein
MVVLPGFFHNQYFRIYHSEFKFACDPKKALNVEKFRQLMALNSNKSSIVNRVIHSSISVLHGQNLRVQVTPPVYQSPPVDW